MKRSPYKHWEFKLAQDRERTRARRMWNEAYTKRRRGLNKYTHSLKWALACMSALTLIVCTALCVRAAALGVDVVVEEVLSPQVFYGIAMRGMIVLIAVLFAAYLLAGWIED